jgi:predicted transcriptional regulator
VTVSQNTDRVQPGARSICHPARPQVFVLDGQRLRQLRRQHGLSQQDLVDQAGISLTTVARLERQPLTWPDIRPD